MPKQPKPPPKPPAIDEDDGVLDELQAWYLGLAEREGVVYTWVLRQLMAKLYRDRDYLAKRAAREQRTSYDWALERDAQALAWAVQALVRYCPDDIKEQPEPPKPARKPPRRLPPNAPPTAKEGGIFRRPKRDWNGPELPPKR